MLTPSVINNTKLVLDPKIIHEDNSLIVLDKPSGWITDNSNTATTQPVIQKWVADNFKTEINSLGHEEGYQFRNGIVHRLDKETSGILLVAKTKDAFVELQRQFKERMVHKIYIALVHGKVEKTEGIIDETVGRLPWRRDRFGVLADGREAVTEYKVISNHESPITKEQLTLLELAPKTGRTHQIRIHLKHIGHPIVADEFYAGRKTARNDRKWCRRLFLHAGRINFIDPVSKKKIEFSSPLPSDLADILK